MSDDLTVMIAATAQRWGESRLFSPQAERNPDVATPEAEPRPCGSPRPPRAMPPGRLRSPPAAPGPRSRASVPDALPAAARRAGRRSWRRTRSGPCPRRRRRPDPCRERWRHSSARPPPPQRASLRLGLHGQLSDPPILHRIALAVSEASIPPIVRVAPARHAKAAERPPLARHRPVSGPAGKAWPGENVAPSSPPGGPWTLRLSQSKEIGSDSDTSPPRR